MNSATTFRAFAREMGFGFEDIRTVYDRAEQFYAAPRFRGPQPDRGDEGPADDGEGA